MKRQTKRNLLTLFMFLLLPLMMKFFSPVATLRSATAGIIAASTITIVLMFFAGMFTGRLWCGWLCPAGGVQDIVGRVHHAEDSHEKLHILKYILFILQAIAILFLLATASEIKFDYFYSMDFGITNTIDWIVYLSMIMLFFILPLTLGKRSYCRHICLIAPVMIWGQKLGKKLGIKHKVIHFDEDACIHCNKCNKACPMHIDVMKDTKDSDIVSSVECITCYACVDACPKKALK